MRECSAAARGESFGACRPVVVGRGRERVVVEFVCTFVSERGEVKEGRKDETRRRGRVLVVVVMVAVDRGEEDNFSRVLYSD